MQDGIIKGTGNSRYLKSISNFLTQYPTYQDFVAALVAGTLPIDFNGINETGWDQLGTALNKVNLLQDSTCEFLGISTSSVPDDAFVALGVGAGNYAFGITLTYPDGTPVANTAVSGVTDRQGEAITTDEGGYFLAISNTDSITFSVQSPYFDVASIYNKTITATGLVTKQTVPLEYKTVGNYVQVINSTIIKFSRAYTVDFTAVGGGGGGGGAYGDSSQGVEGAGGGGGYVNTVLGVSVARDDEISIRIGSGGDYNNNTRFETLETGGAGGTTTITLGDDQIVSANGGKGGQSRNGSNLTATGGAGNGKGGDYEKGGQSGSGYIFNSSELGLAGGGGGGGGASAPPAKGGGAPYGATGGTCWDPEADAGLPRGVGGGGGGGAAISGGHAGASRGSGGTVYMRWEAAT